MKILIVWWGSDKRWIKTDEVENLQVISTPENAGYIEIIVNQTEAEP